MLRKDRLSHSSQHSQGCWALLWRQRTLEGRDGLPAFGQGGATPAPPRAPFLSNLPSFHSLSSYSLSLCHPTCWLSAIIILSGPVQEGNSPR